LSLDENDRLKAGTLPHDPTEGTTVVANDVPRVLTDNDLLAEAVKEAFSTKEASGLTSGHFRIDDITGGFRPEEVTVFGADTSVGKSSFLVMVADENMKKGKRVLIVSCEDGSKVYGARLLLRRGRHSAMNVRQRRLTEDDRKKIVKAGNSGGGFPVFLDARGRGVEWLSKHVKRLIREQEIDLVAFDYLQAFDNEKRQQDRRNQLTYIARVLTDVTKTAGVSGLLFSQVTVEKGKVELDRHSIRDSRDVSNAAEIVMLCYIADKAVTVGNPPDVKHVADAGQRCIYIDKNKNGPPKQLVAMEWDDYSACFNTVEDPEAARFTALGGRELQDFGDNLGGGDDPW
jgi:replicative DNA helicase